MSMYEQVKNMPNPSPGLLKALKKTPAMSKVWAFFPKDKKCISLARLNKTDLSEIQMFIGNPFGIREVTRKGFVRASGYAGVNLKRQMFTGASSRRIIFQFSETPNGIWMFPITDRVFKALNEIGACSISPSHCEFERKSPKIKQCKFCGTKAYKKISTVKVMNWETKEGRCV